MRLDDSTAYARDMDAEAFYGYLRQARRELWTTLRTMPDDALSKAVIPT